MLNIPVDSPWLMVLSENGTMAGGEAQAERGFDTYFIHHHTVYELDWRIALLL